jgi:hypothetical protein
MITIRRFLGIVAIPLVASNCMALSGRCLYELRGVVASGKVDESGTEIAAAELNLGEQRDYEPDKNLTWSITGPSLKGHVQQIVLRENRANGTALFTFPVSDANIPSLSSGFVRQSDGATINGVFDLLSSNRGAVVITTDLGARPTVTIPLTVTRKDDWSRPYCS